MGRWPARWKRRSPKGEQMALGVDVAQGGNDESVVVERHDAAAHACIRVTHVQRAELADGLVDCRRDVGFLR